MCIQNAPPLAFLRQRNHVMFETNKSIILESFKTNNESMMLQICLNQTYMEMHIFLLLCTHLYLIHYF